MKSTTTALANWMDQRADKGAGDDEADEQRGGRDIRMSR